MTEKQLEKMEKNNSIVHLLAQLEEELDNERKASALSKKIREEFKKKYTEPKINEYHDQYEEAMTLMALGSEVEDKKGLKQAEKEYYNEAEEMLAEIPEDYKKFREMLAEID